MKKFTPLFSNVLLRVIKADEYYEGSGLVRPQSERDKDTKGEVVALGPGKKDAPLPVALGDKVMYTAGYGNSTFKIGGVDHTVVAVEAILGVIED